MFGMVTLYRQPASPFVVLSLITGTLMIFVTSLETIREKWLWSLVCSLSESSGTVP